MCYVMKISAHIFRYCVRYPINEQTTRGVIRLRNLPQAPTAKDARKGLGQVIRCLYNTVIHSSTYVCSVFLFKKSHFRLICKYFNVKVSRRGCISIAINTGVINEGNIRVSHCYTCCTNISCGLRHLCC